jgi:UDP-N-acetylmuramate--alanine ligase
MLWGIKNVHLVGIRGAGMSGIATLLSKTGFRVSGCDINPAAKKLEDENITVFLGHSPERITDDTDVVVFSSAMNDDNTELILARSKNIHVIPRFEMLSEIIRLKNSITVLWSDGKTTTTSLIAHVMKNAGLNPTIIVGGRIKGIEGAFLGDSDIKVGNTSTRRIRANSIT